MNVHFTSNTCEWSTPDDFFSGIKAEFGEFDLDPCATPNNARSKVFFTKEQNGLENSWGRGKVWMNPPYGRTIGLWMQKAYNASLAGATVVCLIPSRTDTAWWHDYAMKGAIRFVRGRLKFGGAKNSAPFPSALVVFYP